jgi:hypothetical protein
MTVQQPTTTGHTPQQPPPTEHLSPAPQRDEQRAEWNAARERIEKAIDKAKK